MCKYRRVGFGEAYDNLYVSVFISQGVNKVIQSELKKKHAILQELTAVVIGTRGRIHDSVFRKNVFILKKKVMRKCYYKQSLLFFS